jgi:hypothetical protein
MKMNLIFSKWTAIGSFFLMGAAIAWAIKLSVIVSSNGRIIDTGAAALFMKIGLVFFLIGSTAIGHHLSRKGAVWIRTLAVLFSPVVVFGSFLFFAMLLAPLVKNSPVPYVKQESAIAAAVFVYLTVGWLLYRSDKALARS